MSYSHSEAHLGPVERHGRAISRPLRDPGAYVPLRRSWTLTQTAVFVFAAGAAAWGLLALAALAFEMSRGVGL